MFIALLRSKGGKANCYDENGRRHVGDGNGDFKRLKKGLLLKIK